MAGEGSSAAAPSSREDRSIELTKESKKRMRVNLCGGAKEVEWEKYALNFHEQGVKGSTGWVMHEYSITSPPEFAKSPMRVYFIRHSGHGKNAKKHNRDEEDWDSDDEVEEEVDDATLDATWCATEEDPALFIDWSEKWG